MTKIENEFRPDYVSHPGETLAEVLESLGMTQAELATRMGRPRKTINEIIQGRASITPETALQLEMVFRVPASFWNNRQRQYDDALVRLQQEEALEEQVSWLNELPLSEMKQRRWIKECDNEIDQLKETLQFFGAVSAQQCLETLPDVNFRQSSARAVKWWSVMAWLRKGELEAQAVDCQPYDASKFRQTLNNIRGLTVFPVDSIWPEVTAKCAAAGVAVVTVEALPHTGVYGATKWLASNKALILLSLRGKRDDQLWFSFFHEGGHVYQHGKSETFLEWEGNQENPSDKEDEANRFAANLLIPVTEYQRFVQDKRRFNRLEVLAFAKQLGIAPGIVVGRLQHDRNLPPSHLNDLKRSVALNEQGQPTTV